MHRVSSWVSARGVPAVGLLFLTPLTFASILLATLIASLCWVALMFAPIFPHTAWVDPEFAAATPSPLDLAPQQLIGYLLLFLLGVAMALTYFSR